MDLSTDELRLIYKALYQLELEYGDVAAAALAARTLAELDARE